jgi:hypothetical protein
VRFALLVLVLGLSPAYAQEDEGLLDTPTLGEGIPERMQELEREWAEDTGVKEPVDPPDDADAVAEPADPAHDDDAEPAKAPAADEPEPEPPSSIRKPAPEGARRAPLRDAAKGAPSRAERRATSEE